MKSVKFFMTIVLCTLMVSCTKNNEQEPVEPSTTFKNSKTLISARRSLQEIPNPENTIFELDLHKHHVESTLKRQYEQKKKLLIEIEEGNDELIPELEKLQGQVKDNEKLKKLFYGYRGPVFPTPPIPLPCIGKEVNCRLELSEIKFFLLDEKTKDISVKVKTLDGEVISENSEVFNAENFEGLPAIKVLVESEYSGEVKLVITKFFPSLEKKITYDVEARM